MVSECTTFSLRIPAAFATLTEETLRHAAATDWTATLPVDQELLRHLGSCSDCSNDVLWYLAIREHVDVAAYPCIHIAYASRLATIDERHGVYAIRIDARGTGSVIGFCPWCGLELNVAAFRPH